MKISSNFKNLPTGRKEEIRDIAISISFQVNEYYLVNNYVFDLYQKLAKAYSMFQKYYKRNLTEEEISVFCLYVLFPNDNRFMEMIQKYKKDYQKIANLYSVSEVVVRLRYLLQKCISLEKELDDINANKKTMS